MSVDRVWMTHPDLDEGRWMPRTAVPFHAAAGWSESEPPPEPKPEPKDKPPAKAAAEKKPTPRRPSTEEKD